MQEINKSCQRNKEAKSSLPPQDAQLSTLFNGIFSHVLPTPVSTPDSQPSSNKTVGSPTALKGRFRVSVVVLNQENDDSKSSRSMSLDTGYISMETGYNTKAYDSHLPNIPQTECVRNKSVDSLVSTRIKWLQDLNISDVNTEGQKKYFNDPPKETRSGLPNNHILDNDVFLQNDELLSKELKQKKISGMTLPLDCNMRESHETEQKVRRLSSPTISTAPTLSRKTHSIKGYKGLEGLDLRSTVPLSPTRLHESFGKSSFLCICI